jgi:hypothetical protein
LPTPTDLGLPDKPAFEQPFDEELGLRLFQLMVRTRRFEKRAYDLFLQNLVKGTSHLSLGPGSDFCCLRGARCAPTTGRSRPTAGTHTPLLAA